jgi:oligosaccharide reducing-end xylanase
MNRKTVKLVTLLLSTAFITAVSAGIEAPFEVGTWGNFCKGALSFTFDDYPTAGATHIVSTGREAFDAKKFHMTIFAITNSQTADSWKALDTCFAHGHEIGSHNYDHNSNSDKLLLSQTTTKAKVPGEMCISFAYPNGTAIAQVPNYYVAARDAGGSLNSKTPSFAHIGCTGFGAGGHYDNTATAMNSFADQAAPASGSGGWAVEMHHGIGADTHNWATTNLDEMKKHLEYLDGKRNTIWVETFGNVARYIKERDAASLKVKTTADTKITLELTDNLADSIYNFPLTVRRPLPDGWTVAIVTQKDKPVDDSVITVGSTKYVMFKAVPDGGDIVISKDGSTYVDKRILEISPVNPVIINKSSLTINPLSFSGQSISVSLFDLKGELVARYSYNRSTTSISVPLNTLANSAFVVKVTDGKTMIVNRCLSQM